jgi:hypothetical protein
LLLDAGSGISHATAGVALIGTGSGSESDLEDAIERLRPGEDICRHRHGSRGHGRDHVLPAFISGSLTLSAWAKCVRWARRCGRSVFDTGRAQGAEVGGASCSAVTTARYRAIAAATTPYASARKSSVPAKSANTASNHPSPGPKKSTKSARHYPSPISGLTRSGPATTFGRSARHRSPRG